MPPRLRALRVANSLFSLSSACTASRLAAPFAVPAQQRSASILASLSDNPGAYHKKIRRGRGPASGKGKTAGRGQKGQHAHGKVPAGFQGGQTPLSITKPVRGRDKYNPFKVEMSPINLDRIQSWIDQGRLNPARPITMKELNKSRCIHGVKRHGVKLLGRNAEALQSPIHIVVSRASASAIARVEALGGSVTTRFYSPVSIKQVLRGEAHPTISWQADEKLISLFTTPGKLQNLYSALGVRKAKLKRALDVDWDRPEAVEERMQTLQADVQAFEEFERLTNQQAPLVVRKAYIENILDDEELEGEEREARHLDLEDELADSEEQIDDFEGRVKYAIDTRMHDARIELEKVHSEMAILQSIPAQLDALKLRDDVDKVPMAPYTTYKNTLAAPSAPEVASREAMKAVMQRLNLVYPKTLADATSRKDIEYYRDPAHRGYLSYKVKEGESPSLFFKPPREAKDKKKQTARRQAAKASADNRLF
ncbi:ribosomal protein L15 [Lophiostoma macrostomum CBS 122681]|uniref:Ribosomal protein L15 n=1 Tax=Lophiostoma macrostomum CBS 122681 TaxID=1314788 RepID=A0A6A6T2A8_9PLEO|nr:ribosomal protein L15 [Lophiostoma macrostomum CBS 122681]